MTPVTFAREGYPAMLDALLRELRPWIRLYTNDPAGGVERVRADFVEAVFPGYAAIRSPKWTPAWLRDGRAFSVIDPCIFAYTTGAFGPAVRGYHVTDGPDGGLLWWRRLPGDAWTGTESDPVLMILIRLTFPPAVLVA